MSDALTLSVTSPRTLRAHSTASGGVYLTIETHGEQTILVDLTAVDAKRLRDWLVEHVRDNP